MDSGEDDTLAAGTAGGSASGRASDVATDATAGTAGGSASGRASDVATDATVAPASADSGRGATSAKGRTADRAATGHDATIPSSDASGRARDVATDATLAPSSDATIMSLAGRSETHAGFDYPGLTEVDPAHYILGDKIAQGGMGKIVAARDRRLGRPVALKTLLYPRGELAIRFEREARITARLQHPGIVQIHEAGRFPNGDPFFAMKLVEGRSLDEAIAACETVTQRLDLLSHVLAVADAMAYAHSRRVIHRDIKPRNVLVGAFGETVVIDWGLAKDLGDAEAPDLEVGALRGGAAVFLSSGGGATIAGDVIGTPAYMPVEQARGETVDERADVYAIGALLYHVLSGEAPYTGATAHDVLEALRRGPPPPLRDDNLPPDLVAIVAKAMARDPAARYPTSKELATDLRNFVTGQLVGAHEYSAWQLVRRWLRRHRAVVAVALVGAVALSAFAAYSFRRIIRERDAVEAAQRETVERDERLAVEHAQAIAGDDPTLAVAALHKLPAESPHWRELRPLLVGAALRGIASEVMRGHAGAPQRMVIARDGRVVTAGPEGAVRIWSPTGADNRVLEGHRGNVNDVAISPGGVIASIGIDGTAQVWPVEASTARVVSPADHVVTRLVGITADDRDVLLLTRSAFLACPVAEGACRELTPKTKRAGRGVIRTIVDTTGREVTLRTLETWTDLITHSAVSPTARIALSCDGQRTTAWDLDQGVELWTRSDAPSSCTFTPRGEVAAAVGDTVRLIDAATGADLRQLAIDADVELVFSADGTRLATAKAVWSVADASRIAEYAPPFRAFAPDGRRFAAGSDAGVTITTLGDGAPPVRWRIANARQIAFAPDGRVYTGHLDGSVRMWPADPLLGRRVIQPTQERKFEGASADGAVLGLLAGDRVQTLAWRSGQIVTDLPLEGCKNVEVSPDARWLAALCGGAIQLAPAARPVDDPSAGSDPAARTIELPAAAWLGPRRLLAWRWNSARLTVIDPEAGSSPAGRELALGGDAAIAHLLVARDGDLVAAVTGGRLVFYSVARGEAVRTIAAPCRDDAPTALSRDGTLFACATGREIWLASTTAAPVQLRGHYDLINGLAFTDDGTLASTARDRTLRAWRRDGTSRSHALDADAAARPIAAGGRTLITRGADTRVWDLDAGRSWTFPTRVDDIAPLGDGRTFAIATDDGIAIVTDELPADTAALRAWVVERTRIR